MTREEATERTLKGVLNVRTTILNLGTGYGKTKICIDCINKIYQVNNNIKISIIVPRSALIDNWFVELKKWNLQVNKDNIEILCYNSLHKVNPIADVYVFDEAHHLSDNKKEILSDILASNTKCKLLFLSATLNNETRDYIKSLGTYNVIRSSIADGIEDKVLPTPIIYKIPLRLNIMNNNCLIVYNKKKPNPIKCFYRDRFIFKRRYPNRRIDIECTEWEYYSNSSDLIDYYKKKFIHTKSIAIKNKWLREASNRLKFLSDCKISKCKEIISYLSNERTLLFCNNIEQSLQFDTFVPINSKNNKALENIDKFNNHEINHISSVNMLTEGMNLVDCRIGLFCNINASNVLTQQKIGRLLRHKNPIIIIPYYMNTRDEELVNKMLEEYDKSMIHEITYLKDIKL